MVRSDVRRRLLREFFLNACLMAMVKRVGEEAVALEELEEAVEPRSHQTMASSGCGCGVLAEVS